MTSLVFRVARYEATDVAGDTQSNQIRDESTERIGGRRRRLLAKGLRIIGRDFRSRVPFRRSFSDAFRPPAGTVNR